VFDQSGELAGVPACHPSSKQTQCHSEVLVPEPSISVRAQAESRIYWESSRERRKQSSAGAKGRCHDRDRKAKVNRM